MRGKILQYNGSDGRGTIVAEGQQYPFGIAAWRGDAAPVIGKTVELGVFLLGTIFFNAISLNFLGSRQGQSLWNLARMLDAFGGGGGIKVLLMFSYAGFAVPFFWKDRRGWLVLLLPLVTVAYAFLQGRKLTGGLGGGDGVGLFDILGIGMYLSIVAAVYIAMAGLKRYKSG